MYVSEFRLEDYPVREQDVLHTGRAAFDAALNTVNVGKFNLCTASIGICEHAMYEAVTHAHRRVLYGKPVTDFPHVRRELTDAYARLVAMKLFSDRAVDYFRSAGPDDRRYLLFNPMTKMKVTTEGERVIDLLWDVIAAKGFETDTYFDKAAKDIRGLPKLEGTVHVNLALILKFMPNYLFQPGRASRRYRPGTTPPTTSSCSGRARPAASARSASTTGAIAYDAHADLPNVARVPRAGRRAAARCCATTPRTRTSRRDLDFLLTARPAVRAGRLRPADPGAGRADRPRPRTCSTRSSPSSSATSPPTRPSCTARRPPPRSRRPGRWPSSAARSRTPPAPPRCGQQVVALCGAYEMQP